MNAACTRCNGADHQRDDCAILRDLAPVKPSSLWSKLVAAIHREESPGVLADLNKQLERAQ